MDLTTDHLLGGQVSLTQPREGFRTSIDAVFLASFVTASPEQTVLDIGCGVGPILLCLGSRLDDLNLMGVEERPEIADLARLNLQNNSINGTIMTGSLYNLTLDKVDVVVTNPPYLSSGTRPKEGYRENALFLKDRESFKEWTKGCFKVLKPQGWIYGIHRADRLGEVLVALTKYFVDIEIVPLYPKLGSPTHRILFKARKPTHQRSCYLMSPSTLSQGFIIHENDGSYTPWAQSILYPSEN